MSPRAWTFHILLVAAWASVAAQAPDPPGRCGEVEGALGVGRFSVARLRLPPEPAARSIRVPVEVEGRERALLLERRSVRSPGFRLLVQGRDGALLETPAPEERTYRGTIEGEPRSTVAASLVGGGLVATVRVLGEPGWCLRPLRQVEEGAPEGVHVVYSLADLEPSSCGGLLLPGDAGSPMASPPDGTAAADPCDLRAADVAFDSDYEFFDRKASKDPEVCLSIVEAGLDATNLIYERDVKITHRLAALIVRSDPATDIYAEFPDASDFGAMLTKLREYWNANMGHIDRDAAYLLTGKPKPEYGGLAFVSTVCSNYAYGMGIGGWGYETIFRHEVGHNWSCGHDCGFERGYIMCGNSFDAISHYNALKIRSFAASRDCLDAVPYEPSVDAPPYARPVPVVTVEGAGPLTLDVLGAATDASCDRLRILSHDRDSAFGASLLRLPPASTDGTESLLYVPRSGMTGTDFLRAVVADEVGRESVAAVLVRVRPRGLVAYLRLDETTGAEAADSSGRGHGGELRGALTFDVASVAGRHGGALSFPGDLTQYVSLGADPEFDLRGGLTVTAWFRADAFSGSGLTLVGKGDDAWRLGRSGSTSVLRFACDGLSVAGGGAAEARGTRRIDDGAWHHAAGVWDGRRLSLYVDGELDASVPASGLTHTNGSSVRIGGDAWKGAIDEVRLYDFGLDAEQVALLHEEGLVDGAEPADGAEGIVPGSALTWTPAPSTAEHDLYLGTSRAAVDSATRSSPEYLGRRGEASYTPRLDAATTYFWRVDEVSSSGTAVTGEVRRFRTAFAYTDFDEPPLDAASWAPGPGDVELGFRTVSRPTEGQSPFAGVIDTGSTPTTPIFSHRSVDATTTFDSVALEGGRGSAVAITLQARDTGYEEGDELDVRVTNGAEEVALVRLGGGPFLGQVEGTGYASYSAAIPRGWGEASLVVSSSSDSSQGSERFDFDRVRFFCHEPDLVLGETGFAEAPVGASSWSPGPGSRELGFRTASEAQGAAPRAAVVEWRPEARFLSHSSVRATTIFDAIDLRDRGGARATIVLRVLATTYETGDSIRVRVTDGVEEVGIVDLDASGINGIADGAWTAFWAEIPEGWESATVVVETSSNSSAGAEGYDFRLVEVTSRGAGCGTAVPPEPRLVRGDANADGRVDLSDGIRILNFLFLGTPAPDCLDASDVDDGGIVDISDGIGIFNFLFLGGAAPAAPGPAACGTDPSADDLGCASFPPCP